MKWVEVQVGQIPSVYEIRINRPDALNAINREMLLELAAALTEIEHDHGARVVLIAGVGKAFIAGADIRVLSTMESRNEIVEFSALGQETFMHYRGSRLITIGLLNGYTLGGGLEFAMALDFRVGHAKTRLGLPEANLGIIPGFGGTQMLRRIIGTQRALWLTLSGETIAGDVAFQYGLIDWLVPIEDIWQEGYRIAEILAKKAPDALKQGKQLIYRAEDEGLSQGLTEEVKKFSDSVLSRNGKEGCAAFLEKRDPKFTCD